MCLFIIPLGGTAWAAESSLVPSLDENSEFVNLYEDLSDEIKEVLTEFGVTPQTLFQGEGFSIKGVWKVMISYLESGIKTPFTTLGLVIAVLLFCLLFHALCPGKNNAMNTTLQFFVGFCIAVAFCIPATQTLSKTVTALNGLGEFMLIYIPAYAGVLLAMGRTLTVSGAGSLVFSCCQVMTYLAGHIVLPFISMFQAFALCEAVGGGVRMGSVVTCVKRIAMWIMGISATAFSGVLCLTGFINGAGDSVAQRTTRFFIGNMIPVIGGALSDSMAMLQGCFSLLKTGSGVLGLFVILAYLLPVLLEIVLWRMVTMVLVSVSGILEMPRVTALLQSAGESFGLVFGVVLSSIGVYVVSLSVLMVAGG